MCHIFKCQSDKEWAARKFENSVWGLCRTNYINGTFVFVCPVGELPSYDIMDGKLKNESFNRDDDFNQMFNSDTYGNMRSL